MSSSRALAVVLGAFLLLAGSSFTSAQKRATSAPPNIVVILIDTLRADHLPFYGYGKQTAPFLSGLARKGVVFEDAVSTSSLTAPATASLFTSLYPEHHGIVIGRLATQRLQRHVSPKITLNRIPEPVRTLGEVMKAAGYGTWGVSDNYNVSEDMGFAQGFDSFISNPNWYWGAETITALVRVRKVQITRSSPYFLYIHYIDPHFPYHKREPWFEQPVLDYSYEGPDAVNERRGAVLRARYDSEIAYVDDHIGKLFRLFKWDVNTLLIVTSDHGEEFYEHGDTGHGKTLYDEVLKVPLLLYDSSGRIRPGRVGARASLVDILPTIIEYAGGRPEEWMQGRSLMSHLLPGADGGSRPGAAGDRPLFAHLERYLFEESKETGDGQERELERYQERAVMSGEWKLIVDSQRNSRLFKRADDPAETVNVFDGFGKQAAELTRSLEEFARQEKRFGTESFDWTLTPDDLERLRSLGYVQ